MEKHFRIVLNVCAGRRNSNAFTLQSHDWKMTDFFIRDAAFNQEFQTSYVSLFFLI